LLLPFGPHSPRVATGVFIAPNACVIGDVEISEGASIWFGAVLRGDERAIRIGPDSNVQDLALIHTSRAGQDAVIGARVTIGHRAIVHGCTIHDDALIGMGAIVLDDAVVESGALVAAGAVVAPGKHVRTGELWAGCPARHVGDVTDAHRATIASTAPHYRAKAAAYLIALAGVERATSSFMARTDAAPAGA
jgi:carbonic anhydrase/acetyltransferase-like protein (isoleucine patch superfamily)